MLLELHIRNFAIIHDLRLQFHPGLNVLTGETGAGKSIIVDALGLLLGDRALTEWVRAGAERAEIEATFRLFGPEAIPETPASPAGSTGNGAHPPGDELAQELLDLLAREGLDDPAQPHLLTLSREVRLSGRNIARVNGRAVSLQILSEIANRLVDIHGQGEHLSLLRPRSHVHLLDRYAGLLPLRRQLAEKVRELRAVRAELQRLRQDARTVAQRLDMLAFQVEEITNAALEPGEDEALEAERRRLGNAEALLQLAQAAQAILDQGGGEIPGAIDLVSDAVGRLERLARIDPTMAATADLSQSLLEQLQELARELQDYGEGLEFNPARLAEVEDRLELIHNLKRKYGDSIPEILAFGEAAQAELAELSNWEARTEELEGQEEALLRAIGALAGELSQRRQEAGEAMARQVEAELAELRMAHARFQVAIHQREDPSGAHLPDGRRVAFDSTGADRVEFTISANPGEPLKPLAKVASGGETSRLMLALKGVLAQADATPTLIFDEIDQGIGGRVGAVVGEKLWRLTGQGRQSGAVRHQVICITHLPQLAAFGDQHLSVGKHTFHEEGQVRTGTQVRPLAGEERVAELMQMLGATSDAGRRSVEEMLEEVARVKEEGRSTVEG